MAFTYSATNLDLTDPAGRRNWIRFRTGDTVEATALLQDEEIDAILASVDDNVSLAAIVAVESMIAIASKQVDYKTGKLTVFGRQLSQSLRLLLIQLKNSVIRSPASVAGTPPVDDEPIFEVGMDDNPGILRDFDDFEDC